jgi:hypothetical protein
MNVPEVHIVQVLIRGNRDGETVFLLYPHDTWKHPASGESCYVFSAKKTVAEDDEGGTFLPGESLESFVDVCMSGLGVQDEEVARFGFPRVLRIQLPRDWVAVRNGTKIFSRIWVFGG